MLDAYYAVHKGPLGSTDRKCAVDIDTLFEQLNAPDSVLAKSWGEKDTMSWVETLGSVCPEFAPASDALMVGCVWVNLVSMW